MHLGTFKENICWTSIDSILHFENILWRTELQPVAWEISTLTSTLWQGLQSDTINHSLDFRKKNDFILFLSILSTKNWFCFSFTNLNATFGSFALLRCHFLFSEIVLQLFVNADYPEVSRILCCLSLRSPVSWGCRIHWLV